MFMPSFACGGGGRGHTFPLRLFFARRMAVAVAWFKFVSGLSDQYLSMIKPSLSNGPAGRTL